MNNHFTRPKKSRPNKTKTRRFILPFILASLMTPASISTASANDVVAEVRHAIMCLGLLFTDPPRHLIECGVGDLSRGPLPDLPPGTAPPPQSEPEPEPESEPYTSPS